jgi:hypothetical protein
MQLIKSLFKFYVFANIHVAVAGFCLTQITIEKLNLKSPIASYFVAFSIVISYNFIRYYEIKTNRILWFRDWFYSNKRSILVVTIIAAILLLNVIFLTNFNQKSLQIVIPFAIITFFYVIPLIRIGQNIFTFRNFPSIKIFSIAVAWAGITVIFPAAENSVPFSSTLFLMFMQQILFVTTWTIPFDIRDVNTDESALKTLPQLLGIFKTKVLATMLLVAVLIIEIFVNGLKSDYLKVLIIISVLLLISVWLASEKRNRMYTAFWVESIPIIWLALIIGLIN